MNEICSVPDCERPVKVKSRGLCSMHNQRLMRHGSTESLRPRGRVCEVEGCDRKHASHGYCGKHAASYRTYGDPLAATTQRRYCALCSRRHHALGLCAMHYHRWLRWDDPFFDGEHYYECSVDGCLRRRASNGMCALHLYRLNTYGDPLGGEPYLSHVDLPMAPLVEIVEARGGLGVLFAERGIDAEIDRDRIERRYHRGRQRGWIDLTYADHLCCVLLRVHPALIWPEDYWNTDHEEVAA